MADPRTNPSPMSVTAFLNAVAPEERRKDCRTVATLMTRATKAKPRMWGSTIVGFGRYHYKYASGREGDWFVAGFSPRKQDLTLYVASGFAELTDLLARLGKYKTGRSCLYIRRLSDIDLRVLEELIERSAATVGAAAS